MNPPPDTKGSLRRPLRSRADPLNDLAELFDRLAFKDVCSRAPAELSLHWVIQNAPTNTLEPLWESSNSPFWMIRFAGHFAAPEALTLTACECARTTLGKLPSDVTTVEAAIREVEANPLGNGDRDRLRRLEVLVLFAASEMRSIGGPTFAARSASGVLESVLADRPLTRITGAAYAVDAAVSAHAPETNVPASAEEIEAEAEAIALIGGIIRRRLRSPTLGEVIDLARRYTHVSA